MARKRKSGFRRTRSGKPTARTRRRYGVKGRFPIGDRRSAMSALRLRGHARSRRERSSVIRRAARYAPAAARRARARDKKAGKL